MSPNFPSRTIFIGDNLKFLRAMNDECIDLIYADPPFNKRKNFTAAADTPAEGAGFRDHFNADDVQPEWARQCREANAELHAFLSAVQTMDAARGASNYHYLLFMAVRLLECRRVLKSNGAIYLHCDYAVTHYLRLLLDCIFGARRFRNEIVWHYAGTGNQQRAFPRKHDTILFYAKGARNVFNRVMTASAKPSGWTGKREKRVDSVWRINTVFQSDERANRSGWPTQKPLPLLRRIIAASSNPGDWVLDPFCGCATTCIAAELLGRRWLGMEIAEEVRGQAERRMRLETAGREVNFSVLAPEQRGSA